MRRRAYLGLAALVLAGAGIVAGARGQGSEPRPDDTRLQPYSRIEIIRYVSGEFARVLKPLPGDRKGVRIPVGQPVNEQQLRQAAANHGVAANPGDMVQVTRIEFKAREIVLDINGGAQRRRSWRERVQVSVGGLPSATVSQTQPGYQARGSTLVLDFGRPLPDMGPDELKAVLAEWLDFSPGPSAAEHWVDTLPEEFREAIREQRAVVGMNREMVIAAMGRPERKVREREPDGTETEDWIYGNPPARTIFVKFAGETVIDVREFP